MKMGRSDACLMVAAAQMVSTPRVADNLASAERLLELAADSGARLVVLPEYFALISADARVALPAWSGRADAWFLDGFSPAKNPELWGEGLMAEVAAHTAPGGTFATYTAAGHVRRALAAAGFAVTRAQGFAGKRHMSRGQL